VIALLAAAVIALSPATPTPPSPTLDPSDTQCYRGSLYCPPPIYGGGNQPCTYVLGHWVNAFGANCATGSGWHAVPDGAYAPKGATA
jgi:hypothetical protein